MNDKVTLYYDSNPEYEGNLIESASQIIPDWYKQVPRIFSDKDGSEIPSVKHCLPFIEALSIGYLILTPEDYKVEKRFSQGIFIESENETLGTRNTNDIGNMPIPAGYNRIQHTWQHRLAIDIPEGYSVLFTNPLNRFDTPFMTFSAVVDGPYKMPPGGIAFCIRDDFEGVIPAGTPYAQAIPFKRDDFNMVKKEGLVQEARGILETIFQKAKNYTEEWTGLKNNYRINSWHKKSYKLDK